MRDSSITFFDYILVIRQCLFFVTKAYANWDATRCKKWALEELKKQKAKQNKENITPNEAERIYQMGMKYHSMNPMMTGMGMNPMMAGMMRMNPMMNSMFGGMCQGYVEQWA